MWIVFVLCSGFLFLMIRAFERSRDSSFANFTDHSNVLIDSFFHIWYHIWWLEVTTSPKYIGIRVEFRKKMGFLWSIVDMDLWPLLRWWQVAARGIIIYELWEKDCLKPLFRCTVVNNVILKSFVVINLRSSKEWGHKQTNKHFTFIWGRLTAFDICMWYMLGNLIGLHFCLRCCWGFANKRWNWSGSWGGV